MLRPSYKGSEGGIELPPGASTRTRLHELGHQALGHEPGLMTVEELTRREIDAEAYSWEKMGKELTHRVGIPALGALLENAPDLDNREVLNLVVDSLRIKGITVTSSGRGDLKYFLEEYTWL